MSSGDGISTRNADPENQESQDSELRERETDKREGKEERIGGSLSTGNPSLVR